MKQAKNKAQQALSFDTISIFIASLIFLAGAFFGINWNVIKPITVSFSSLLYELIISSTFWTAVAAISTSFIAYVTYKAWMNWKVQQLFGEEISLYKQIVAIEQEISGNIGYLRFAFESSSPDGEGKRGSFADAINEKDTEIRVSIAEIAKILYVNAYLIDEKLFIKIRNNLNCIHIGYETLYPKLRNLNTSSSEEQRQEWESEADIFIKKVTKFSSDFNIRI